MVITAEQRQSDTSAQQHQYEPLQSRPCADTVTDGGVGPQTSNELQALSV